MCGVGSVGGQRSAEIIGDAFVEATRHCRGAQTDGCGGSGEPPSQDGGLFLTALTNSAAPAAGLPSLAGAIFREVEGCMA